MQRRDFLALTAAVSLALPMAARAEMIEYTPGLVDQKLESGQTVFVDFHATWCGTCAAQTRVIEALLAENPVYAQMITFVRVDWDTYKDDELTTWLNIPRRSTLVVLKGQAVTGDHYEVGRIVAGTSRDEIKALLDAAMGAATAS